MKSAPYQADTRAKGWRFEVDHERIRQSDTWALSPAEIRPWLLMLWMVAWEQTPCGSLPSDDALISARIGMSPKLFQKHREIMLRGWWHADDGRLYHNVLTQRVHEMLEKRAKDAKRSADRRVRSTKSPDGHTEVTRDACVTHDKVTGEFGTKHQAPSTNTTSQPDAREVFAMRLGWNPSGHLADMAKQAGVSITPAIQQEFIAHWMTQDRKRTQAEWDKALLQSALHRKAESAGKPQPKGFGLKQENFADRDYGKGVQAL